MSKSPLLLSLTLTLLLTTTLSSPPTTLEEITQKFQELQIKGEIEDYVKEENEQYVNYYLVFGQKNNFCEFNYYYEAGEYDYDCDEEFGKQLLDCQVKYNHFLMIQELKEKFAKENHDRILV